MSDNFQGWPEEAQRFFLGLQLDNSKAYFETNRATYLRCVRGPMEALVASVEAEFGSGKIFRPNRDIRFSADKSPYKTETQRSATAATSPFPLADSSQPLVGGTLR